MAAIQDAFRRVRDRGTPSGRRVQSALVGVLAAKVAGDARTDRKEQTLRIVIDRLTARRRKPRVRPQERISEMCHPVRRLQPRSFTRAYLLDCLLEQAGSLLGALHTQYFEPRTLESVIIDEKFP